MIRSAAIAAAVLSACWGCTPRSAAPDVQRRWEPGRTTGVRVQAQPLGEVPNSGLQLPAVSPDEKWIAYLRNAGQRPPGPEALFTGRGLEDMSLHVRALAPGAKSSAVCDSGAAWPAWSADGTQLIFVAHGEQGRSELRLYRPATGTTRRLGPVPGPVIMMPAMSPAGRQVAFVAVGADSSPPRLHVLTLETGKLQQCPDTEDSAGQLWPHWTGDGGIIYVLVRGGSAWLAQWYPGRAAPRRICRIPVPTTSRGAYQCFAGLGSPLSPDGRRFAYYDTARDRIVLVDLSDGSQTALAAKTRAGCWLDSERFAAASDTELMLTADRSRPVRLMRGSWLPRGPAGQPNQLILCGKGSRPFSFALVRLTVLWAQARHRGPPG